MSITRLNPNTVFLGGEKQDVSDLACSIAVTPGMLVERFNNGGIIRWRPSTGNGTAKPAAVALDHSMANKGVDDNYAIGDLVEVALLSPGAAVWALIASGQNVSAGDLLGDGGSSTPGTLKTSPTVALFTALENKPTVTSLTRIRVEAL